MPEAAVHEYDLVQAWEHQVWASRKILAVKPVSESPRVKHFPNEHFGSRVALTDSPHPIAAL